LLHPDYATHSVPFGGSSNSDMAVGIYLKSPLSDGSSSTLFQSVEASFDPHLNIGFRHPFKPLTNFAQGQRVGPATQQFG